MLTFEQIKELIDQVAGHGLNGIEVETSDFRLKVDGHTGIGETTHRGVQVPVTAAPTEAAVSAASVAQPAPVAAPAAPAPTAAASVAAAPAADASGAAESVDQDLYLLKSPIVGTFYRSPNPDSPAFVEVGDRVQSGQILCIVEAMKLMNEIESDADGSIVKVHVKNAQPVEYGEPLFTIKLS